MDTALTVVNGHLANIFRLSNSSGHFFIAKASYTLIRSRLDIETASN